jgi:hypothetical protein
MKTKIAILAVLALGVYSASAATLAYTEAGTEADSGGGYGVSAFDFTVSSTINVTDLGFYALSIGGGDTPHIYLWDVTTNTQLADSGSIGGSLSVGWHYTTLSTPVTLTPGDTYQVSAPIYFTPTYSDASSFSYGSEITSAGFYRSIGGFGGWTQGAVAPVAVTTNVPTGANFQYTTVPEPSVFGSILTGAAGLLMFRRRRA